MLATKTLCAAVTVAALLTPPALGDSLTGTVEVTGSRSNADAVVYVDAIPGKTFQPPSEHAVMDQRGMKFVPRVVAVQAGGTVDFLNSDNVAHNVFTPDECAGEFDLGNWNRGEVRSWTFDGTCVATILCFVHTDMEAFVVAVPTPYFAVTDDSGRFDIQDLPDGSYTVKVWHPARKGTSQSVTVRGATEIELTIER